MNVVNIILIIVSFILFSFYYIAVKELNRINYSVEKRNQWFDNLFLTIILILFLSLFQTEQLAFVYTYIIYFYIAIFALMLDKKNIFFSISFVTVSLIFVILNFGYFNSGSIFSYVKIFEPVIFLMFFKLTTLNEANRKRSLILNIFSIIVLFLLNWVIIVNFYETINYNFVGVFILLLIYIPLQVSFIIYIDSLYNRYFTREKSYQKNEFNYFKPHLNSFITTTFLKNESDNIGFVFDISFKNSDSLYLDEKYFHEFLQNQIRKKYPETIFFMKDLKTYSFIIPIELNSEENKLNLKEIYQGNNKKNRSANDILGKLDKAISPFKETFNIKLYGSIYGLESNDINQLFKLNDFLKQKEFVSNYDNNIIIYDQRLFDQYLREKQRIIDIFKNHKLRYKISEQKIDDVINIQSEFFHEDDKDNLNIEEINFINRFLIVQQIKRFNSLTNQKNLKLTINISYLWLMENYEYFKARFNENIDLKSIIINIDLKNININLKKNETFLNEISNDFDLRVIDFESKNIQMLLKLDPTYISAFTKSKVKMTKTKLKEEKEAFLLKDNVF